MSEKIVIKNKACKEKGYIRKDSKGKQTAYDQKNVKLGIFDPRKNITKDIHDRVIGTGNKLIEMILGAS